MGRTSREQLREREARAARLRAEGWTLEQIANELGYADASGARKAVERALERSWREPAEAARRLALDELDALAREAWKILRSEHYATSFGRVATHPQTGQPLVDDGPTLRAIEVLLRVQERRSKLFGLDHPPKSRVEVITQDQISAEIARLEAEIAERGGDVTNRRSAGTPSRWSRGEVTLGALAR